MSRKRKSYIVNKLSFFLIKRGEKAEYDSYIEEKGVALLHVEPVIKQNQ